MAEACPTPEELRSLSDGSLDAARAESIADHLDRCENCRGRLEALTATHLTHVDTTLLANMGSSDPESAELSDVMRAMKFRDGWLNEPGVEASGLDFLEPAVREGSIGRFGGYDVLTVCARGPMGIVLKAYEAILDRTVAIKVLSPSLAQVDRARERFLREARAMAAIRHENVVVIHAVAVEKDLPFLVMPFIEGPTLQQRLKREGRMSLADILSVGHQVADGLSAAHRHGLIHRDIKPSNILFEKDSGRVRITDFGLARTAADQGLTQMGEIAGTPQFMSPEQAEGKTVDHRTDLFSMGSVLYNMASGRSPFDADSVLAVVRKVIEDAPKPVGTLRPELPEAVTRAIDRLLEKRPEDRFQSAAEFSRLLEDHVDREEKQALRESVAEDLQVDLGAERMVRRVKRALAGLAAGAALILGGLFLSDASGSTVFYNTILSKSTGKPYYLRGKFGVHQTLAEAVEFAESGDVVEIRSNNRLDIETLVLDRAALTIRAAAGYSPTLVTSSLRETGLSVRVPLILEGIEIRREGTARRFSPMIDVDRAPVLMLHCRLVAPGIVGGREDWDPLFPEATVMRRPRRRSPLLNTSDSPRIHMVNCEIHGSPGPSILVQSVLSDGPMDFEIFNCLLFARNGLMLRGLSQAKMDFRMYGNTFLTRFAIISELNPGGALARFDVWENMFLGLSHFMRVTADRAEDVRSAYQSNGGTNRYESGRIFYREEYWDEPQRDPLRITQLEDWISRWDNSEKDSEEIISEIEQIIAGMQSTEIRNELTEWAAGRREDSGSIGVEFDRLGPGAPYERWRRTAEYRERISEAHVAAERWTDAVKDPTADR